VTDIVVVKGDPSTEELAALTVALLTVAAGSAGAVRRPHAGHRRPPVAGHGRAVVSACGCG
jgi:Acyl-CoA carboxylase epsilon subunit